MAEEKRSRMGESSKELVSIVVSVYNVEAYLPKCLESVTRQTYDNLDIIIIDDGSTDGSGALCDAFAANDARARVFHQENHGLWAVRNRGQLEALGDYLLFVDGDDYFHDDYVRLLYEAINKDGHPYPMAVCGYDRISGDDGDITSQTDPVFTVRNRDELINGFFDFSIYWSLSSNWDKMYRKSCLDIPFQRNYPRCQDMESNLHALFSKIDHAIFIPNVLYHYRRREGQLTKTEDYQAIKRRCICDILYTNFLNVPESLGQYRHLFLHTLYKRLYLWKELINGDEDRDDLRLISYYERRTILPFLFCRGITLRYKIHKILQLNVTLPLKRLIGRMNK